MKMINFLTILLIFVLSNNNLSNSKNLSDDWKKIIPLVSTCEDIKNHFDVRICEYPRSIYKLPKYTIVINFSSGKDKYKVKKGTVLNALFILKEPISLNDFGEDLGNYEKIPILDLPDNYKYINKEKGIELNVSEDKWVNNIILYPPQKVKSRCKKSAKN